MLAVQTANIWADVPFQEMGIVRNSASSIWSS